MNIKLIHSLFNLEKKISLKILSFFSIRGHFSVEIFFLKTDFMMNFDLNKDCYILSELVTCFNNKYNTFRQNWSDIYISLYMYSNFRNVI